MYIAVIGSNYGDEGKGLAADYFASRSERLLGVRHNGGAQSGHTVEIGEKRFVFHELSSGSFRGADTYWAETFFPDLYKLSEEIEAFAAQSHITPRIFASPNACFTTVDDVLINMAVETARGDRRHGSCGMGINEAVLRKEAGFGLTLGWLRASSAEELFSQLKRNRREYSRRRLREELRDTAGSGEYLDLLNDENVLYNYAETAVRNLEAVSVQEDAGKLFDGYADVLFESGQGLLLDAERRENWPHVTASRTGLFNVLNILSDCGRKLDTAVYVSRSYLTKHGAGPLKNELEHPVSPLPDRTNTDNPWQGSFRYACFESPEDILSVIGSDLSSCPYPVSGALMLTHLNETDGNILLKNGALPLDRLLSDSRVKAMFDRVFLSGTRFSSDIREVVI